AEIKRTDGLQHLELFVAQCGRIEGSRRFDGHKGSELKDVALDHVAEGARGFVEAAAAFDAERLARGELHMIHIVAIPNRLQNAVAEAMDEQVLNGVLTEIVIDPIDLRFVEDAKHDLVELLGRSKIAAERLFDDDARPRVCRARLGEAGATKVFDDLWIDLR